MTNQDKAVLVISGKMLDRPFSLDVLDALRAGIERALSDQDVVVTRRVATLSMDRFLAAPFFLQAGFEVVPADDEDMQACAILMESAMSASHSSPAVAVFALGESQPAQFLRLLAGKIRRALIVDDELTDDVAANLESAFDLRAVLTKEGIDLAKVHFQPWAEWSAVLDGQFSASSESTEQAAIPAPSPTPTQGADATSTQTTGSASNATPSVDELCETQDAQEFELFERSAPEWNEELEKLVMDSGGKCSAWSAVQVLAEKYPHIHDFYLNRRDEFVSLLDDAVRYIPPVGENTTSFFYHYTHDDMRTVSAENAVKLINVGSEAPRDHIEERPTYETFDTSFEEIADKARVMTRACRLMIERNVLAEPLEDNELFELARSYNIHVWQSQAESKYGFTKDGFENLAKRYEHLERVYRFVGECMRRRDSLPAKLAKSILQLAANAQCMLKSILIEYGVPIKEDSVQWSAFGYLSDFRRNNYGDKHIDNLKMDETLPLEALDEEREKLADLRAEYVNSVSRVKNVDEYLKKIKYEVGQLKKRPELVKETLGKIVDSVTILCRDYSMPYSSKQFRDILSSVVDDISEYIQEYDVDATDEFVRVVQEIDVYNEEAAKAANWAKSTPDEDRDDFNPEILAVRKRYNYGKVVFIGGTPQSHLIDRLQNKLHVELVWFETDHGDSLDRFNRYLNDENVKLFLVYIPWCSHKHSLEFAPIARDAGKDFVRITKGTSAASIARHICDQLNLPLEDVSTTEGGASEKDDVAESTANVDAA